MKHLRKFNESKEIDIFSDESILHDILLEYSDMLVKYSLKKKVFILHDDEYFMPIGPGGDGDWTNMNGVTWKPEYHKGYQVSFEEFYKNGYSANDIQRGDNRRVFGKPNDNFYKFFEITKDVQYRIESMGYIFLLSTHKNAEFDFMIIENK